ncbi:hypothetical protein INT47_003830 [Mucor saturninus]|uniref:AMP-activated protein kinase glycogen-binding domain-containing protein n=1 Tax=Mucor saturninus TaxID=64648 RepID=A0A8H7QKT8_9FUNG|nr:hypothetical protein INT47_003830 [Mucor saturninus]
MRDWLALPLSPSSPSSIKNSSDEDDCSYDIVHRSCNTSEEDEEDDKEPLSSWVTLLAVFGVVRHTSRSFRAKTRSISTASPLVLTEEEEEDEEEQDALTPGELKESEHLVETAEEIDEGPAAFTEHTKTEASDDEYEQEISMKRSLSASSIASSSDSDNSTPACSQIMRPSKFFDEMTVDNTLRSVQISWNHGGKMVQVTGEFNNWSVPVDMVQETQCHVVSIPMDPSKDTEFKFIVDGEWRYAMDLPHRADGRGNVNNVICKQQA